MPVLNAPLARIKRRTATSRKRATLSTKCPRSGMVRRRVTRNNKYYYACVRPPTRERATLNTPCTRSGMVRRRVTRNNKYYYVCMRPPTRTVVTGSTPCRRSGMVRKLVTIPERQYYRCVKARSPRHPRNTKRVIRSSSPTRRRVRRRTRRLISD